MKKTSTIFLQIILVLLGVGVLALLLWEPQMEGVNAHATNFEIYFKDPFLAIVYVGSIAFFVGLYKAFRLLGYARQNKVFSTESVKALQTIKYCAITIIGFVIAEEIFIMLTHGDDDAVGGFVMGLIITLGSVIVATVATVFEKTLQKGLDIKSENDLTV